MTERMEAGMSKLLQVRLDEKLKNDADNIFSSMGLDTSTAIRMFLIAAVETRSMPFEVKSRAVKRPPFEYGCMSGDIWMSGDFDEPLDDFAEYAE